MEPIKYETPDDALMHGIGGPVVEAIGRGLEAWEQIAEQTKRVASFIIDIVKTQKAE